MATESIDLFKIADGAFERLAVSGYKNLAEFDKVFVSVWSLKGEVDNGGFDQWFFNSSGDWAVDTPRSLEEIGAVLTAVIVEDALELFPGGDVPEDLEERRKAMESTSEKTANKWNELSDRFYKEEENLDTLLSNYVLSNKKHNAI